MRSLLVTNCRADTTKHMTFRRMVLPFSQCLHGKDAFLRLRNMVPAVWRATITEKKNPAGTDAEPSAPREGLVAGRSWEHLADRQHGLKTCQTKERLENGLSLFQVSALTADLLLKKEWRGKTVTGSTSDGFALEEFARVPSGSSKWIWSS